MHIIPKPVIIKSDTKEFDSFFIFTNNTFLQCKEEIRPVLETFINFCEKELRWDLKANLKEDDSDLQKNSSLIRLEIDSSKADLGDEGYLLNIQKNLILISALTTHGLFYGIQSLKQILLEHFSEEIQNSNKTIEQIEIPIIEIKDYPRFSWRGFMLDEGRHFHGMDTVKKILDMMALLKMNVFHWHLTEDQGWRIEIKKYPLLTEIGSKRKQTRIGGRLSKTDDGKPHEGFYTQEEIKEIVEYAKERYIKIIPEIDMPGHSVAAIAAYPHLGCTGKKIEVETKFGIFKDVYCVGKETTIEFIQDVLSEVMELFPSEIIHIGGDEVPKDHWKKCGSCQAKISEMRLKNEEDLQTYFTNRIAKFLESHGRRAMGWNEILNDNLVDNAVGQFWFRGKDKVVENVNKGRDFIMSEFGSLYLDYNYNMIPLEKTYNFEPVLKGIDTSKEKHVLGLETPLWTEWVPTRANLEWKIYPRLIAVAESGWIPKEAKNYTDFSKRLEIFMQYLDSLHINHAKMSEANPNIFKRIIGIFREGICSAKIKFD